MRNISWQSLKLLSQYDVHAIALVEEAKPAFEMYPDMAHGRLESSKFWISEDIDWLEARHEWPGLKSICVVEAVRGVIKDAESTTTRRYYISSLGEKEAEKKSRVRFVGIGP